MKLVCILLCVTYATCFYIDDHPSSKDKIFQGRITETSKLFYQATFEYFEEDLCGATIIGDKWMALTATCFDDLEDIRTLGRFRVGTDTRKSGGRVLRIKQIIKHELYNEETEDNNVAVAELEDPIPFNENQTSIRLAKPGESPNVGDDLLISGFGSRLLVVPDTFDPSPKLLSATVKVLDTSVCDSLFETQKLTKNMLCVDYGASIGDSGGPAVFNGKLAGIISTAGIGLQPSVYMDVSQYYHWFKSKTNIQDL